MYDSQMNGQALKWIFYTQSSENLKMEQVNSKSLWKKGQRIHGQGVRIYEYKLSLLHNVYFFHLKC